MKPNHILFALALMANIYCAESVDFSAGNPCVETVLSPMKFDGKTATRIAWSLQGATGVEARFEGLEKIYLKLVRGPTVLFDSNIDLRIGIKHNDANSIIVIFSPSIHILGKDKDSKIVIAYDKINKALWGYGFNAGEGELYDPFIDGKDDNRYFKLLSAYLNEMKIPKEGQFMVSQDVSGVK